MPKSKKKIGIPAEMQKRINEQIERLKSSRAQSDKDTNQSPALNSNDDSNNSANNDNVNNKALDNDNNVGIEDISQKFKAGEIIDTSIAEEMKRSYIDYAMSVIVSRALPDVKDGLKPSQRRILVAMRGLQLWPNKQYRKCAKIIGDTTGDYHPHGDQAAYDTLVHMAQPFNMRYPLVHGQGNFGSIDGDPAAHMRYTEAKMDKLAVELLNDLDKGTVLYTPNYDGTKKEPLYLPAAYPNLICNGGDGIAVGMATKILPHNLTEVINALIDMIEQGNKWGGVEAYNELRKLRESHERVPMLLNSEPESFWENYVNNEDPQHKAKMQLLSEIIEQGRVVEEGQIVNVFGEDAPQILKFAHLNSTSVEATNITNATGTTAKNSYGQLSLYPEFVSHITTEELMKHIKAPDFPMGGEVYDKKRILNIYETGRGRVTVRGKIEIKENKNGNPTIIITDIPYQVNRSVLIQDIAKLVQFKKIKGIKNLRDETDRIVIELKKSSKPQIVVNRLYKYTALQSNLSANTIALVNNEPVILNLKRYLELYLKHRITVFIRKLEFELAENKYRDHILQGLLKALDFIEEVIKTIRASTTQDEAKTQLMERFDLTHIQAQAILDMQLRRLAALERQKIEDEHNGILKVIEHHESYLADRDKILELVKEDLIRVKTTYGDTRRTKVVYSGVNEPREEDLVPEAEVFITLSNSGYIKRTAPEEYRMQKRGGKGSKGASLKNNDYIKKTLLCSSHDTLLIFSNEGKVYRIKAYEIPETVKTSKGVPIVNLISVNANTKISTLVAINPKVIKENAFLVIATKNGLIKKTKITEYENIRQNGLQAITLKDEDKLVDVILTSGKDEIIMITKHCKSIRFKETQVKATGRNTMGVKGIRLGKDDELISLDKVRSDEQLLLCLSSKGYAKFTKLYAFKAQNRGGSGIFAFKKNSAKLGHLIEAKIFDNAPTETDEIMVISRKGIVIKTSLKTVPILNRQTGGVRIMKVKDEDEVVGVAK